MYEVYNDNPKLTGDETLARWGKMLKAGGKEAADATNELISAQAQGSLPKPITDPEIVGPLIKSVCACPVSPSPGSSAVASTPWRAAPA
jgi:hypothetical protein